MSELPSKLQYLILLLGSQNAKQLRQFANRKSKHGNLQANLKTGLLERFLSSGTKIRSPRRQKWQIFATKIGCVQ